MTYVYGKWLNYLRIGYNMFKMTYICGKWQKHMVNGFSI